MYDLIAAAESVEEECCGFLFGYERNKDRVVTKIMKAVNVAEQKERRYEISPLEYLNAERFADRNNLMLLGFYHSHVNHPATPSESDRKGAYPGLSYVIISVTNQKFSDIRSWRLNESGRFDEEIIGNQNYN